jgi:hypothetical protein
MLDCRPNKFIDCRPNKYNVITTFVFEKKERDAKEGATYELSTPRCKLQRPEVVDVSYRLTDLGYDTRAGKGEDE